jgi:undecaprenyl-diphosphatase
VVCPVTLASIDVAWYRSVNEFARDTRWAHGAVANYANWAGLVLLAVLLVAGWLSGRRRDDAPRLTATAFLVGVGAVLALLANQVIGPAFARPRPCHSLSHVEVLVHCATDSSFPSDHAMIAGAFAAGLLLLHRNLGLLALLLALLLAFTRIYVGVHYPTDVAGGLAIGATIGAIVVLALRPAATAVAAWLVHTPLRPLIATTAKDA